MAFDDVIFGTATLEPGPGRSPARKARPTAWRLSPLAAAGVILVAVAAAALVAAGAQGPGRGLAVGAASLLAPGAAALPTAAGQWGRSARLSWIVVMSIVTFTLLATGMALTALWAPRAVTVGVLVVSAWVVAVRFLRPAGPRQPDGPPVARRITAAVLDGLPVVLALAAAGALGAFTDTEGAWRALLGTAAIITLWSALSILAGAQGATGGMRLLGLQVVDATTGRPLGARRFATWATAQAALAVSLVGPVAAALRSGGWADGATGSALTTRSTLGAGHPAAGGPAAGGPAASGPAASGPAGPAASTLVPLATLVLAGSTWALTTALADVSTLGGWGLTPALGPVWFAALALVAVVLGVGLATRLSEGWIAAHLTLLVVMLYGTPAFVEVTPRLPWAFKHIAVTRYIEVNGSVDFAGDIYQRWPGMFAWTALLADVTGYRNPVEWAFLAEIGFGLLNVLLVLAIARALSPGSRWAWGAATLYAASNWVAQNYFAPQSLAYAAFLFVSLLVVLHLGGEPRALTRRLEGLLRARPEPASPWPTRTSQMSPPAGVLVAVLLAFATIIVSHQLTPYVALLALLPLAVLGYQRPFWVAVATAAMTLAYLVPHLAFVDATYGILSSLDVVDNATYSAVDLGALSPAENWQRRGTLLLAGLILVLGALGLLRRLLTRRTRSALVVGWLAVAPLMVMLGQSYGGEIRLRAYLFALPWVAIGASWLFEPRGGRRSLGALIGYPVAVAVLVGLFAVTYFQPAAANRTSPAAVNALEWINDNSRTGDVVLTSGASPASIGERYPVPSYSSLSTTKLWLEEEITVPDVIGLAQTIDPDVQRIVVVITDAILDDVDPAPFAPGEIAALYAELLDTPGVEIAYEAGDVRLVMVSATP